MATKKASKAVQVQLCTVCNKPLKNGTIGATCANHVKAGYTPAKIAKVKQALSVNSVPANYIKLAQLHKICKANFVPISKMVKAIGGDRALNAPAHAICKPVYFNNVRYVNNWLASKAGLQAILTGNFSNAPAQPAQPAQPAKK